MAPEVIYEGELAALSASYILLEKSNADQRYVAQPIAGGPSVAIDAAYDPLPALDGDNAVYVTPGWAGIRATALPKVPVAPRFLGTPIAPAQFNVSAGLWEADLPISKPLPNCVLTIRSGSSIIKQLNCATSDGSAVVRWDGTNRSGSAVPNGPYTWTLNGSDADGPLRATDGSATPITGTVEVVGSSAPGESFRSITPVRLLDSRQGGAAPLPAGTVMRVKVAGENNIPADALAASLNVTVTQPQAGGAITVYPCSDGAPSSSNLNYSAGQTIANAAMSGLGATGEVCLKVLSGATHLIVDINGWFPKVTDFVPILPVRLLDSRTAGGIVPSGGVVRVKVAGANGIPDDASAASLNVTVTQPAGAGAATVFPCGAAPGDSSTINFVGNQTIPNAALTRIGSNGEVCIRVVPSSHVIVDVNGWFTSWSDFSAVQPVRLVDTRQSGVPVPANGVLRLRVAGVQGVPGNASAASLNVTVTGTQGPGAVTLYPCGAAAPQTSTLNFSGQQTIANAALTGIGPTGDICVKALTSGTDMIVDFNGWFK
jgi:hypothetical protein